MTIEEIMKRLGFEVKDTGGGCLAYSEVDSADDAEHLITGVGGAGLPLSLYEPIISGYYDPAGEQLETYQHKTLRDYLQAIHNVTDAELTDSGNIRARIRSLRDKRDRAIDDAWVTYYRERGELLGEE